MTRRATTGRLSALGALAAACALALAACGGAQRPDVGPRGTVRFSGEPAEAVLEIDERRLGPIGLFEKRGVLLRPGAHRIVVRADGYFPEFCVIEVTADQVLVVDVALRPVPE